MTLEESIEAAVERGVRKALESLQPKDSIPDELLSPERAAKLADVSEATIRRWVAEGLLTRYGSKHALRVRRVELLSVKPKEEPKKTADDIVSSLLGKAGR